MTDRTERAIRENNALWAQSFEDEGVAPGELRLAYPYWEHPEPLTFPVKVS